MSRVPEVLNFDFAQAGGLAGFTRGARGNGSRAVLFVHGFPLSGEMWSRTPEAISDHWACIVPDLRGHGRTPPAERVSIESLARDLWRTLDLLGVLGPPVIVGLSLGGIVAFEMFRQNRSGVRALVLCCTRSNPEPPEGVARREAMAQAALTKGSGIVADMMIGPLFAPGFDERVREEWRARMARTPPLGIAATARALGARPDSGPTLAAIDVPTLVVAGEHDTITPPEGLLAIHDRIAGSRFEMIAGCAHMPPVEQPDAFARVLGGFLDSLAPG